jgi:hypothetical protein
MCVFIGLVFWRPQEWLVPWLFGWPILQLIMGIALLTFLAEMKNGRIKMTKGVIQPYLLFGLWIATIMSHVAHFYFQGMMDTIPDTFKFCFFTAFFFYTLERPSRFRTVAIVFVIMSCVMAIHAIMQDRLGYGFVGMGPMFMPATDAKPEYTRSYFFGTFGDPNDLAQILATSIPFCFALTKKRSLLGFIMGCAIAWLLITAIMATHSRGGLVALATVGAVMFALILPARWMPAVMLFLLGGALVLCPLSAGYLDESAHDRVVFWGLANWVFKHNWMFGIGYGMFWQVAEDRAAHNAYVYCYTELGVFGYFFWFSLMQLAFMGAWRTRVALRNPRTDEQAWIKRFSGLGVAALAGYSASAYFLSRCYEYPLFFLFAIFGALPIVAKRRLSGHQTIVGNNFKDIIACMIGTLLSIVYVYWSIILLNKAYG